MCLNYIGRRTAIAMVVIALVAILNAALGKQPDSCSPFSGRSVVFDEIKRPKPPLCLETLSMMASDALQVQLCRAELSDYADKMDRYSKCLMDENKMSILEGNAAIDKFNCIVKGSPACY